MISIVTTILRISSQVQVDFITRLIIVILTAITRTDLNLITLTRFALPFTDLFYLSMLRGVTVWFAARPLGRCLFGFGSTTGID